MSTPKRYRRLFTQASKIALAVNVALFSQGAFAEDVKKAEADAPEVITVTGSRIKRAELVSSSAVASVEKVQIKLDRAINVEDITAKLPQAAAGANSTGASVGDSFGSSTIDLRGLGQNRTLVLIDGTRATPFSFRNAVDVNAIPAGLIKRVDILTGGAAAIYGADAVSGVVNFILDDDFDGLELSTSYETADGGNNKFNIEAIYGTDIGGDAGHVTGYVSYSDRSELLAGERSFALKSSGSMINTGGYYTDVLSGNSFGINDSGAVTSDLNTIDVTGDRFLTQPMERLSAGLLYNYDLTDNVVAYGRVMYSQVTVDAAGTRGQTPISVNETVVLTESNPYIPDEVRDQLSFDANGNADVLVNRNIGLGVQYTDSVRDTFQFQFGLKGDITDNLNFDVYAQYGKTDEDATVINNAYKNDSNGNSRFGQIANTVDIFDPNLDSSSFSEPILVATRSRTQDVFSATLSGNSSDLFELPAGALEFAVGYEYRDEAGVQKTGEDLGNTFGAGGVAEMDAGFDTSEFFAELLVPIVADAAFAKSLSLEFAYRISDYSNTEADDTYKIGLNWEINDSVRIRANTLTAFRAPNIGEFAGPSAGAPLSLFDPNSPSFIPRLAGRFNGDPCLDGTGDATQCAAQGAAPVGTPFDSSQAEYTYGGNPDIKPEKAESQTVGVVFTPTIVEGLSVSVDYYNIEITDAVSVIQPAAALQSCYIDNPTPGNSLCGAVTRDPATGLINRTLVNDFNLSFINQSGFDVAVNYEMDAPEAMGGTFSWNYQASIVTDQTRQNDSTADIKDCKGTYGGACSGDGSSFLQADYKHRATMGWNLDTMSFQLGWRQIGEVDYAVDRSETIDAQNYVDFAASWQATETVSVNVGIDNLFDEQPPTPDVGANHFNTVSDYNVVGRSIGLAIRYTPNF